MADNIELASGSGGAVLAADDISGVYYPYSKIAFGVDSTVPNVVTSTATNPFPVALSDTDNAVLDAIAADASGIASSLRTIDNGGWPATTGVGPIYIDDADWTDSNSHHMLGGGVYQTTPQTITDGDTGPFQVNANGYLKVAIEVDSVGIGGGTQYAIDDAGGATDTGTVALAIRDDSLSTLAPSPGNYVGLRVNSTGALHVTGGGGGTEYNVDDINPTVVSMAGVVRDDALTTLTEADGDVSLLRVSSKGALHVTGGGGGTEYTEDVLSPNPQVGTATMMERDDVLTTVTPAPGDWIGLRGSAEGALWVQDFNSDAILADTNAIDGKITACNTGAVVLSSGTVTAVTTVSTVTNLVQMGSQNISMGTGARDAGTQRVTIASDDSVPVTGSVSITADSTVDVNKIAGVTTAVSNGVVSTGVQRVTIASDSTGQVKLATGTAVIGKLDANSGVDIGDVDILSIVPGTAATNLGKAEDAAHTTGDVGVMALAVRQDIQADFGADGDYVPVSIDARGAVRGASLAGTSGGATPGKLISAATTNATNIKSSAGQLFSLCAFNTNAAARYLKLFNDSGTPDPSADTPVQVYTIPGNTAGAGLVVPIPVCGMEFTAGIAFATTTGAADLDTGAVALNEVVISYSYQ